MLAAGKLKKQNKTQMQLSTNTISSNWIFYLVPHLKGNLTENFILNTSVNNTGLVYLSNKTSYLGVQQIQANSVVHDVIIVRHIPVAADIEGTVCVYKSTSKQKLE